jgi:hypothetical protein
LLDWRADLEDSVIVLTGGHQVIVAKWQIEPT